MAQLYPIDPKKLFALQDKEKALNSLIRIFEDELLEQLDDLDQHGILVDAQVIEGFRQDLLEGLAPQTGSEMEIYMEAVDRAIVRVQGIRQTSH